MNRDNLMRGVFCWAFLCATGWGQVSDDFNDGNDIGWTRLNPLAAVGGSANFSFPGGNTYRMQAGASPDPGAVGQGRAGALREDIDFTAFRVSVDIVEAEVSLEQDFGILARVSSPGLGTLNGYSATFDSDEERLYLSRVDAEQPAPLGNVDVPVQEGITYRIVFHGYQEQLLVEVFDVSDLTTPVVSLSGSDETYASGTTGLFGSSGPPDGTVDVTFDNFAADSNSDVDQDGMSDTVEASFFGNLDQPGDLDFDGDGRDNALELEEGTDPTVKDSPVEVRKIHVGPELVAVEFRTLAGRGYQLEKSSDLESWAVDLEAEFTDLGDGMGSLSTSRGLSTEFLRVKTAD